MERRGFLKNASILAFSSALLPSMKASPKENMIKNSERELWLNIMEKIISPVLLSLSQDQLKASMPVKKTVDAYPKREEVTHLEAFARTLTGIAPWLESGAGNESENKLIEKYRTLAREGLANAVDPTKKDFMNFTQYNQPLVDASFLAQALLRAPEQLWNQSSDKTKQEIINALLSTRDIVPYDNNWILFSAMVETALDKFAQQGDRVRIELALRIMDSWYKGDGIYGDGKDFHFDYYNSLVIQPFLLDIVSYLKEIEPDNQASRYEKLLKITDRHAMQLSLLIAPDGTFPPIGRSVTYRFGVFHLLSQKILRDELPSGLSYGQARACLSAVLNKTSEASKNFDANGWLELGLYGHQPSLAEPYISTGSLYLCSAVFLPLGLPVNHEFWNSPAEDWPSKRIWEGKDQAADKAFKF